MRSGNLLFSAVQFLFVVGVLCTGSLFLALPYAPHVRVKLANFILEQGELFLPLGILLLSLGVALLIGFYWMYHRQYYKVQMKQPAYKTEIELELLRSSINASLKQLLPKERVTAELLLHPGQKIEVIAEFPRMPEEQHETVLEKLEEEVGKLLASQFRYEKEFFVTVVVK